MISDYATNIALINKPLLKVTNIILGNIYNVDEFETEETKPVVINDLGVQKGDDYDESTGKFYHDGEEVKSIYTQHAEEIASLNSDLDELEQLLYEAEGGEPINEEDT